MEKKESLKTAIHNIVKENGTGIFKNPSELRKQLMIQEIPEDSAITVELMLSACPALSNALAGGVISRMEANSLVSIIIQKTSLTPAITRKVVGELFMGSGVDSSAFRVAGELKNDTLIGERLSTSLQKKGYQWSLINDSEETSVKEARKKLSKTEWQDAALSELDRLAEEGNAEANYAIGEYFYNIGYFKSQEDNNRIQAQKYMERSAKLGYGPAFGALADMEILSDSGSLEKAARFLEHPISVKGSDGEKWSDTVGWMMNYQHDNSRRADRVLIIALIALIVSFFAAKVQPVAGTIGFVLCVICAVRAVFCKFRNKYQSHVPEMLLLMVVWLLMILVLL